MLGGVCLNTGTIPSKTLREAVLYLTGLDQREMYGQNYRVKTFSLAMGAQKLGQPVPESNLVLASKRAVLQQMQRKTPGAWSLGFSLV